MQCENDTQHVYDSANDTDARASRSTDYSAPASGRPASGVSLSQVSQSLDFSVENLTAWKRQSETKLCKTVLMSLRKGLLSLATVW